MNSWCASSWGWNLRRARAEEQSFTSSSGNTEGLSLEGAGSSGGNPVKHLHMCLSHFRIRTSLLKILFVQTLNPGPRSHKAFRLTIQ